MLMWRFSRLVCAKGKRLWRLKRNQEDKDWRKIIISLLCVCKLILNNSLVSPENGKKMSGCFSSFSWYQIHLVIARPHYHPSFSFSYETQHTIHIRARTFFIILLIADSIIKMCNDDDDIICCFWGYGKHHHRLCVSFVHIEEIMELRAQSWQDFLPNSSVKNRREMSTTHSSNVEFISIVKFQNYPFHISLDNRAVWKAEQRDLKIIRFWSFHCVNSNDFFHPFLLAGMCWAVQTRWSVESNSYKSDWEQIENANKTQDLE